jgi:UDP:flavonoid glycosyltransferase YjiC (YdhE family)
MLDQPHNAKMLHSLGVARDIVPYAKLNARNLTRAVGKVLANDKLVKEAAAKQGRFVREESEGNGARYVELIIKGHDEQRNDRGLGSAWGSLSQVGGALI